MMILEVVRRSRLSAFSHFSEIGLGSAAVNRVIVPHFDFGLIKWFRSMTQKDVEEHFSADFLLLGIPTNVKAYSRRGRPSDADLPLVAVLRIEAMPSPAVGAVRDQQRC